MEKIRFETSNGARDTTSSQLLIQTPDVHFHEWTQFEQILEFQSHGTVHELGYSVSKERALPLRAVSFGSKDPKAPVIGLFGGVHGLERIGSQVVLSLMRSFCEALLWDENLRSSLEKIRILFFPLINPWGIAQRTRSNPRGVDLMRNAPIEAEDKATWLVGGHRISPQLPWYRGKELEVESKALIDFCQQQLFQSTSAITVDFHSGFGIQDRIWFPYAKTKRPFPGLAETFRLFEMFERTCPHHFYRIEPQSLNYTTHGDLWDYLYEQFNEKNPGNTYIPLAVEMGSWMWIRKNPLQIFSSSGLFNPIKTHRQKRILRRHLTFFDFLIRATRSHSVWNGLSTEQKNKYFQQGLEKWYPT